jgi:hypothetical protein
MELNARKSPSPILLRKPMKIQVIEIPASPSTCLGLDMYGPITDQPEFFATIATRVKEKGGRVVVTVDRPDQEHDVAVEQLMRFALPYDNIFFLRANEDEAVKACPYQDELENYACYIWHKVRFAEQVGVTHFVDDGYFPAILFPRFLPKVAFYRASQLSTYNIDSGQSYLWLSGECKPPYLKRYGDDKVNSVSWRPKAYGVSFTCDIESVYKFVRRWDGVVYSFQDSPNGALVVIPDYVNIREVLKAAGNETMVFAEWLFTP